MTVIVQCALHPGTISTEVARLLSIPATLTQMVNVSIICGGISALQVNPSRNGTMSSLSASAALSSPVRRSRTALQTAPFSTIPSTAARRLSLSYPFPGTSSMMTCPVLCDAISSTYSEVGLTRDLLPHSMSLSDNALLLLWLLITLHCSTSFPAASPLYGW